MFSSYIRRDRSPSLHDDATATRPKAYPMNLSRIILCSSLPVLLCAPRTPAQSGSNSAVCDQAPGEDALVSTCAPSSFGAEEEGSVVTSPPARIALGLPSGTPLRIVLDQRVRISHPGEVVRGKVVETVYAFDQPVIPAGSVATGHVIKVDNVTAVRRTMSYANGDFSPFRKYGVTFDTVTLPDGRKVSVATS